MMKLAIDTALADRHLLGAALGDLSTWQAWVATLKAAHGRPLTEAELGLFHGVAGGRSPPTRKVRELVVVASRRSGKGRMGAALAVHAALLVDHSAVLAPGETGIVACVSPTRAQANILLDYCRGYLESSPLLRGEVEAITGDEIRLRNGNVITTLASDYRSLRGRTLLLAILDEASFLRSEDTAFSDIEAARALVPALATNGMLCILSSPYRRAGLLFERYRDHFGKDGDETLVVAGSSATFNPTLSSALISAASEADPESAMSEWLGEFRRDLSSFLDEQVIEAAIDRTRPLEVPPRAGVTYRGFVDLSGGRHDASVLCIGHAEQGKFIADVIRGRSAPHDPAEVVDEFAALLKAYGLKAVTGDNFSAEWPVQAFKAHRVEYLRCVKPKSMLYVESLPWWNRGLISVPDIPKLGRELRLLERRAHRSGRDTVDHGANGSDDFANALCGAVWLALQPIEVPRVVFGSYAGGGAQVVWRGMHDAVEIEGWGKHAAAAGSAPLDPEVEKALVENAKRVVGGADASAGFGSRQTWKPVEPAKPAPPISSGTTWR